LTLATAQTGTISGILTSLEDGTPVADVPVLLFELGRFEYTDEAGRYTFGSVPVGLHTLRVESEAGPPITHTVTVEAGVDSEVPLAVPGRFFELEGITAEGRSAEDRVRAAAGHPLTEITASDMDDLRQRSTNLVQILRKKGGARLTIHPVSQDGITADYCVESSRPGTSSQVSALARQMQSCRRLLIAVDGQILHSPLSQGLDGVPPSGAAVREILSIDPENIEKVTILSPMQGRFEWGEAGRNGALLITTRRGGGSPGP
ncbi:MAG: carboxypeptidase regulatory-like domain-containing protein, partial [Longimicrobiales bacterium]